MTEAQAWERLYGRRSPDVRVIGQHAPAALSDDGAASDEREYVARSESSPPESEANAA
jgi:hypothetical protein